MFVELHKVLMKKTVISSCLITLKSRYGKEFIACKTKSTCKLNIL